MVEREIKKAGFKFEYTWVSNKKDFALALSQFKADVIVSDHSLPSFTSVQALQMVKDADIKVPFILVTATISEDFAVSMMKEGVADYILKDRLERLPAAISQAIEKRRALIAKEEAQRELEATHKRLMFHIENGPLGFIEWDEKMRIKTWSKRAEEIFGWTEAEARDIQKTGKRTFHEEDLASVDKLVGELKSGKVKSSYAQYRSYTKSGNVIWCDWFNSAIANPNAKGFTIMSLVQDVTEKKVAEIELQKVNRLYAFLTAVNQSLVHLKDEQALLDIICRIAIDTGKFKAAEIGLLDEHDAISMKIAVDDSSNSGLSKRRYSGMDFRIYPLSETTTGKALRTGHYTVNNDIKEKNNLSIWETEIISGEIKSAASFPIKKAGHIAGVFNLLSSEKNFFDAAEITLLQQAVNDISFALDVFEKEKLRRQAEVQLELNEARLKKAQSIAHIGHWELNFSTRIGIWSDETCRIYGVGPDESVHTFEQWTSFLHPEDKEVTLKNVLAAQATLKNISFDHRIVRRNGEVRYVHTESQIEFDAQGNAIGLLGIAHDVTEQKLAEQALRESEIFNKGVLSSLSSHIAVIDADGKIVAVNKAWEDFAKNNGATVLGRVGKGSNYFETCKRAAQHGDKVAAETLKGIQSVFSGEKTIFEMRYPCHAPNQKRWFMLRALNFESDVPRVVTSHENITEIVKAEETLRQLAANLRAIIESSDASIYSIERDFRYLTFNSILHKNLQQVYGLDIKPGDNVFEFLHKLDPAEAKDWESRYREALTGKALHFIKEYDINGYHSFTSFSINPIWNNNYISGLSCFARDITAQKLAEAEIISFNESLERKVKARTEELQHANKELEAFNYTVSHDLQSPLRALSGFTKILAKDYADKLDEQGKEFLSIIGASATRMNELIKDLLEFSRLGKEPIKKRQVNMDEIATVVISETKSAYRDLNFKIKLFPLKSAVCDPGLIKQVWANLIGNAFKYSSKKAQPVIEIGIEEINNEQVYFVKDNGVGFDMALADKLFTVFHRLHASSEFEGTGVGLATVYRIITRHGGHIWAESKKDEGSAFYFTIGNS
jgi:PAS domain S-box-containing protein